MRKADEGEEDVAPHGAVVEHVGLRGDGDVLGTFVGALPVVGDLGLTPHECLAMRR